MLVNERSLPPVQLVSVRARDGRWCVVSGMGASRASLEVVRGPGRDQNGVYRYLNQEI